MAQASYPADLLYHAEHDWARIDADDQGHTVTCSGVAKLAAHSTLDRDLGRYGQSEHERMAQASTC